jgi:hypothetical protein
MTRGIRGTYVYCCEEGLREYLKGFVEVWKSTGSGYVQKYSEDGMVAENDGDY